MANKNGHDDGNVTEFPSAQERAARERRIKRPHEPVFNLPPVTQALSVLIIAIFVVQLLLPQEVLFDLMLRAGFVPARYTGGLETGLEGLVAPVSHLFLHDGWLHLGLNVGTFLAFGTAIERELRGRRLLVLFFATGFCGALAHLFLHPQDQMPLIGASGAISGLFGAVLVMAHDKGLMGSGKNKLLPFILLWIGISIFFGTFGVPGTDAPIAWAAHVGGFLSGIALYRPISRMKMQH